MEKTELTPLSTQLTPSDIKNKEFPRTPFGYSPKEVIAFLDTIAKTWERVQKHEKDLLEKIRLLKEEIRSWENRGNELEALREKVLQDVRKMREEAEREAAKIFAEVENRANEIRTRTEAWLEELIAEVKETERQKSNFLIAFKSALDSHYALIKDEEELKQPISSRLTDFLKSYLGHKSGANETTSGPH